MGHYLFLPARIRKFFILISKGTKPDICAIDNSPALATSVVVKIKQI